MPLRTVALVAATAVALAGCTRFAYQPKPVDAATVETQFEARRLDAPEVRDYLAAQGFDTATWPPAVWTLPQLSAAAVRLHPEIALARARARQAAAETATSKTPLPWLLTGRPEYNTKETGGERPWGLGAIVGLPLDLGGKRAIRTEQLERLEASVALDVAVASWRIRSRLRRHATDLHVAERTLAAAGVEHDARVALLALTEKRERVGYASRGDVATLRVRAAESELAVARARIRREQALAGVAEAVGVPLAQIEAVRLDVASGFDAAPPPPPARSVQRDALTHRIDLRRKLADYAVAESGVKLEVARQYPDVTVAPGWFWDADENIWSVALLALVPPRARIKASIHEAESRREVEAHAFVALQAAVIQEAAGAAARYRHAWDTRALAQRQVADAAARRGRVERQFDAGHADRVDLAQARLDSALAERVAVGAMLELAQALAALEDAVQRPLDNAEFGPVATAVATTASSSTDPTTNPALLDND
jgi:outer membrane protein TolC